MKDHSQHTMDVLNYNAIDKLFSEDSTDGSNIHRATKKLLKLLIFIAIVIASLSFLARVLFTFNYIGPDLLSFFDVDQEKNLPTWYSSVQLSVAGILCLLIYLFETHSRKSTVISRLFWIGLGLIFLFLSLDELAQIHETFDHSGLLGISKHQRWYVYYIPVTFIFTIIFVYFSKIIFRNKYYILKYFYVGGVIFLAAALCGDMVKEIIFAHKSLSSIPAILTIQTTIEEFMEMIGESICLISILEFLINQMKTEWLLE